MLERFKKWLWRGRKPQGRRGSRGNRAHGYTVVEVMMAMSVLSIGATGIVAMQKVTLVGNTKARDLATAGAIAAAWIERLHADSLQWNFNDTTMVTSLAATQYLSEPQGADPAAIGGWFLPADGVGSMLGAHAGADVTGMDTDIATETAFCTNIRLRSLVQNDPTNCLGGNPNLDCPVAIRAEVRVYWLKVQTLRDPSRTGTVGTAFCDPSELADLEGAAPLGTSRYHFVYMSTAILRN